MQLYIRWLVTLTMSLSSLISSQAQDEDATAEVKHWYAVYDDIQASFEVAYAEASDRSEHLEPTCVMSTSFANGRRHVVTNEKARMGWLIVRHILPGDRQAVLRIVHQSDHASLCGDGSRIDPQGSFVDA